MSSITPEIPKQEVYTVFSVWQIRIIIANISASGLISPLTATIYLPLLPVLSDHFDISIQAINLTITVYIIFQAIAPLLLASTSDYFGRRPIYLLTFSIYILASLGLALNKSSYPALLGLRALQSLGASTVLSMNQGAVVDITVPSERGKILGIVLAAGNLGTSVGPIVGGSIAFTSGSVWWAFWALVIFGGLMLISLAFLLPETARNVVGNGSILEKTWNQPLWRIFFMSRLENYAKKNEDAEKHKDNAGIQNSHNLRDNVQPTRSLRFGSPLAALRVIFHRDTFLIIYILSSYYALWYCIQASIPIIFKASPYEFNNLNVGLAYLPGSVGVISGIYLTGKALNHNYKYSAAKAGFTVDKVKGDDLARFPIERARSRWCTPLFLVSFVVLAGYGWAIERRSHPSIVLILQFFQGFLSTALVQCYSTLLVDEFPNTPGTAAAAGNVSRCVLSAVAVAVLKPLVDVMGKGWFFTFLGILCGVGGLLSQIALRKWGMRWRNARAEKNAGKSQN